MTRTVVSDGSVEAMAIKPDGVVGLLTENPTHRPTVPFEGAFPDDDDFMDAPEVEKIIHRLIEARSETFGHIEQMGVRVRACWRERGGTSHGKEVYGKCVKLTGAAKHFSRADFLIWLAADHVRESGWNNFQLEALVFHELKHIGYRIDDNENSNTYGEMVIVLQGHDHEVFEDELRAYGAWNAGREALQRTVTQMPMGISSYLAAQT